MPTPKCVNNYDELRKIAPPLPPGPHLLACDYVFVAGLPDPQNSGLQGFFEWRPNSTEKDNSGTVIEPKPPLPLGRWHRVFEGAISVKWFGATGDGVHDDTPPIAAALLAVAAGGVLLFPDGTYITTAYVQVRSNVNVLGNGPNRTTLKSTAPRGIYFSGVSNSSVRDLTVDMTSTASARYGVACDTGSSNITIENVHTHNTGQYGIAVTDGNGTQYTVMGTSSGAGGAIVLALNTTTGLSTGNLLNVLSVGGTVEANGTWTITVQDSTHILLQGSTWVQAWTKGGVAARVYGGAGGIEIRGCRVDMSNLNPKNALAFTPIGIEIFPIGGLGFLASPGVVIQDTTVIGTFGGIVAGIKVSSQQGARVVHNHVTSTTCTSPPGEGAIDINTSVGAIIAHNYIEATKIGVSVGGGGSTRDNNVRNQDLVVANNVIKQYSDVAVFSADGYDGLILTGNQIQLDVGVGTFAVDLQTRTREYTRVLIADNQCNGGGITIEDPLSTGFTSHGAVVSNNNIRYARGNAISILGKDAIIRGNRIERCESAGVAAVGDNADISGGVVIDANASATSRSCIEILGNNIKVSGVHCENRTSISAAVTGTESLGGGEVAIHVADTDSFETAMVCIISGVGGTWGANGTFGIRVLDSTRIHLHGSTFNAPWTSGGTITFAGAADYALKINSSNNVIQRDLSIVNMGIGDVFTGAVTTGTPRHFDVYVDNGVNVSAGNDTTEDDLKTNTFPKGSIGAFGGHRIVASGTTGGATGNNTVRFYWGGQKLVDRTVVTAGDPWRIEVTVWSSNGEGSQRYAAFYYEAGALVGINEGTLSVNTATSTVVVKTTGQKTNSVDSITQVVFTVERIR